jgi:hypothetical protein
MSRELRAGRYGGKVKGQEAVDALLTARTIPDLDRAAALQAWVEAHPGDANLLEMGGSIDTRRALILRGGYAPEPAWRAEMRRRLAGGA